MFWEMLKFIGEFFVFCVLLCLCGFGIYAVVETILNIFVR